MPAHRILYVCPNAKLGGAEQVTQLLATLHDPSRFEPRIYFLQDGPLVKELSRKGVRCHVHEGAQPRLRNPYSILRASWEIANVIARDRVSLVHSVLSYGHLIGGSAAMIAGVPSTWFQHGPCGPLDWVTGRIPTRTLFVNSEYTRNVQSRYRASAAAVQLVAPGAPELDPASFQAEADRIRAGWGFSSEHLVFALIGRLSPLKGHFVFLDAASQISRDVPSARFVILGGEFMPGDARYGREIRESVIGLGIADRVVFAGSALEPRWGALTACDVIVNSSIVPEGFGLTLVEGMMLGKPVIAPRSGGPLEIVIPGGDGLLFDSGNPDDLASRMREIAEADRSQFSRAARKSALERFTAERMVREIETEYERILATSVSPSVSFSGK